MFRYFWLAAFATALPAAPSTAQEQTPELAQQLLTSTLPSWGRVSSDRLDVHYKIDGLSSQAEGCQTTIRYEGSAAIVINWRDVGEVSFRDLERTGYGFLVKVRRPPTGYVQLYFASRDRAERVLAATNFLKSFCDPTGGNFG